jgi:hypothetical protein
MIVRENLKCVQIVQADENLAAKTLSIEVNVARSAAISVWLLRWNVYVEANTQTASFMAILHLQ